MQDSSPDCETSTIILIGFMCTVIFALLILIVVFTYLNFFRKRNNINPMRQTKMTPEMMNNFYKVLP